jgi:hypothetical protein
VHASVRTVRTGVKRKPRLARSRAPGNPQLDLTPSKLENGLLYEHNTTPGIYRCPSDKTVAVNPATGAAVPPTRSHSMNV